MYLTCLIKLDFILSNKNYKPGFIYIQLQFLNLIKEKYYKYVSFRYICTPQLI